MSDFPFAFSRSSRTTGMSGAVVCTVACIVSGSAFAGDTIVLQPRSGDPLLGLSANELDRFFKGQERFNHDFGAQEGLGPTFNQTSCGVCHGDPALGGSGTIAVRRFGAWDDFFEVFNPLAEFGGSLHQMGTIQSDPFGLDCFDFLPTQAEVDAFYGFGWQVVGTNDPLDLIGEIHRITNSALGAGLVEAIHDNDILAHAVFFADGTPAGGSPPPAPLISSSPTIAGRANMVGAFEDEDIHVGRMGWKGQVATVLTFSADASRNELGITNRFIEQAPAPRGDLDLLADCENIPGINDLAPHPNDQPHLDPYGENVEFIDRITDFQRFLAAPPQTPRNGMAGEQLFMDIGCGQCHIPSYTTKNDRALEDAIANQEIRPYSDFLLHDMGLLGDFIVQDDAGGNDIRTPSLWGLRDRQFLLHDARSTGGFEERVVHAIGQHDLPGSTARASARAFFDIAHAGNNIALDDEGRELVLAFLNSLGRVEFDSTGDTIVQDDDFLDFIGCYSGDDASYVPAGWAEATYPNLAASKDPYFSDIFASINAMDHPCAVFDVDQNGRVDALDFEGFLIAYDGLQSICSLWNQLADGVAPLTVDVPTECRPTTCLADMNSNGSVDVFDLLDLLSQWGSCPPAPQPCPGDIVVDGVVNVLDLLNLMDNWGSCP